MTIEQINNLTLSAMLDQVLDRLLDSSSIQDNEPFYTLDSDINKTLLQRLSVHSSLVKPTLTAMNNELAVLKSELVVEEQFRLDEIDRRQDLETRLNTLIDDDLGTPFFSGKISNPNIQAYFRDNILKNNDSTDAELKMVEMETWKSNYASTLTEQVQNQTKKKNGQLVRFICNEVLDLVAGNNLDKNLTVEEIDQMEIDYAGVFKALQNFRPDKVKILLTALSPDGTFITADDKTEYLTELAKYGI